MRKNAKLVVVLGPTAVGKTKLSIGLARHFGTEIISGDSMLVYRGFNIGTAKPSLSEREGIVHHLIDILAPEEQFHVVDFQRDANKHIEVLQKRGLIPILAGGTALYVKALLEGYSFCSTSGSPEYRRKLEPVAETKGHEFLYGMLRERDAEAADRIHPQNVRRVIRALEVLELGEERLSVSSVYEETGELCYDAWVIGLSRQRDELYQRINQRVLQMFEEGLEGEVAKLLSMGIPRNAPAMQGIGYKETAAFLAGECTRDEAIEAIQTSTRHFAKRQLTWYRKMPYIHWYMADEMSAEKLLDSVMADVRHYFAPEK